MAEEWQDWSVPSVGGDILLRIRGSLGLLAPAARVIAEQVLDDPAVVVTLSITELADLAGASQSTVTRFCQSVGLSGYPELKMRLASELARSPEASWGQDVGADIEASDAPERVAGLLAASGVRAIQQTLEQLDAKAILGASEAVALAGRIDVFGLGGSAIVASELQLRLHRIGRPVWSCGDSHTALQSAALHREGDVFLAISRSGRTVEVVEAAAEARAQGSTTIGLTSFKKSPLTRNCDIVLTTHVQDTTVRHGSLAARYAQLLVVDVVYSLVAQQTFGRSAEALSRTTSALASHRTPSGGRSRRTTGRRS